MTASLPRARALACVLIALGILITFAPAAGLAKKGKHELSGSNAQKHSKARAHQRAKKRASKRAHRRAKRRAHRRAHRPALPVAPNLALPRPPEQPQQAQQAAPPRAPAPGAPQQAPSPPAASSLAAPLTGTNGPLPEKIEGQLIVRFHPNVASAGRATVHGSVGGRVLKELLLPGAELVAFDPERDEAAVAREYERSSLVRYAEPNVRFRLSAFYPEDDLFGEQWGLDNSGQTVNGVAGTADADMDVPEAWTEDLGDESVVVGVADSGVDLTHPDLADVLWRNPGESGGGLETNGVDDDLNGFVDDWTGWDFAAGNNNPADPNGHGTYIAGTVGASAFGEGTAGVASGVSLAPLRICSVDILGDQCTAAAIANAFTYAGQNGMKVVAAAISGQTAGAQIVEDAIDASPGTLFVVAAGNGGADGASDDNDAVPEFPCSHTSPNVLCVAATDQHDKLADFSNYGATSVDLAAPGVNIVGPWKDGQVAYQSGTSPATGYAAGAAALVWSRALGQTPAAVKDRLTDTVDLSPSLADKTVTGGRLNVAAALPVPTSQSPGSPDSTWNGGSPVTTAFGFGEASANGVAVQPDGKVVVAGGSDTVDCDFALTRYLGDGSLDPSFGTGGRVTTDLGNCDSASAVAVDPSTGKIVAGGVSESLSAAAGEYGSAFVRYNANGSLDTSFDGDGIALDLTTNGVNGMAVDSNGRVVAALQGDSTSFSLLRLNTDGILDASFGSAGHVDTDFGPVVHAAMDVELTFDAIAAVGTAGRELAMAQYNDSGVLDTSFSGDGKLTMQFGGRKARGLGITATADRWTVSGSSDSNNSGRIAFTSDRDGNRDIWTMDPDGSDPVNVTSTSSGENNWASWDPYYRSNLSRRLVFGSERDGDFDLYTVFSNGTGLQQVTVGPGSEGQDIQPEWSPDGFYFAFSSDRDGGGYDIYTTDTSGATPTRLTSATGDDTRPAWSPDSEKIAFTSVRDGDFEVYSMDEDGGNQLNLTNSYTSSDNDPAWSPDGSKIVFKSDRGPSGIWLMDADGSNPAYVPSTTLTDGDVSWSPDGTKLIMSHDTETDVINLDGTNRQELTTDNGNVDVEPSWQAVGGFALARVDFNGNLDSSFSGDGKVVTQDTGAADAEDLVVQRSGSEGAFGKVVAVGTGRELGASDVNMMLARYNSDGTLDPGFGSAGIVSVPGTSAGRALALTDGDVVSVGDTDSDEFAVARHVNGDLGLSISPNSGLDPAGQAVIVSGAGFAPNDSIEIYQCWGEACEPAGSALAASTGEFVASATVTDAIFGPGSHCPDRECYLYASGQSGQEGFGYISFSSPSSLEVSPSAGAIGLGQSITLGESVTLNAAATGTSGAGTPDGEVDFFACGPVTSPATCSGGTALTGNPKQLAGGDGGFSAPTPFSVGARPRSVAKGDFNDDGDLDLAVANEDTDNVSILLGGPGGTFTGPTNFGVGDGPLSVAAGDFDGDDDPDLAVANINSNNVSILLGGAGGTFSGPTNYATGGSSAAAAAVGDFDGDDDPDLAVANYNSANVAILLGGSGGTFSLPTTFATGSQPFALTVGRFDGDADDDLAVANVTSNNVSILLGGAGGSFSAPTNVAVGGDPVAIASGDFNGDSDPDLVTANGSSNDVTILVGGAGGSFTTSATIPMGALPDGIGVGDFDGDSDPDLAVANYGGNISLLRGGAGATFTGPTNIPAGVGPSSIAVGTFDGGPSLDLAVANEASTTVSILLGNSADGSRATSDPFTPATAGRYCFRATYAGDATFRQASDSGRPSCVSVRQPSTNVQAVSDFYRTPADGSLVVPPAGVLQNDIYPETSTVAASLDTNPLHGDVIVAANGSFTYIPDSGYSGPDDFTYTATATPGGGTSVGTVTLEVTASPDPLQGTRYRGTRYRGTRYREVDKVSIEAFSSCHSRWVSVNPQVTIPEPAVVKVTAALRDTAGNRIATSDFLVNGEFYGDPFAPTVLTWPTWNTPAPAGGAYADVLVEVDPDPTDTGDEYESTATVLCGT